MGEKQPYVSAGGGAPDVEQKLPAAQERLMVEQAVPLQPMGTRWSALFS